MKALGLLIGAGVLALAAGQADATVTIYLQEAGTNGGAVTSVGFGGTSASYGGASTSYGSFDQVSISGFGNGKDATFDTNNINVASSTGGELIVYLVNTGLTSLSSSLLSTFTSNSQIGLTSLVSSTYINTGAFDPTKFNASNAATIGTLMGTASFNGTPPVATSTSTFSTAGLSTPYSEIVRYDVKLAAGGRANSTIGISGAVPEPASWAMMLAGFGFMGYALRQRRRPSVTFA